VPVDLVFRLRSWTEDLSPGEEPLVRARISGDFSGPARAGCGCGLGAASGLFGRLLRGPAFWEAVAPARARSRAATSLESCAGPAFFAVAIRTARSAFTNLSIAACLAAAMAHALCGTPARGGDSGFGGGLPGRRVPVGGRPTRGKASLGSPAAAHACARQRVHNPVTKPPPRVWWVAGWRGLLRGGRESLGPYTRCGAGPRAWKESNPARLWAVSLRDAMWPSTLCK
jgi:hypothetical protein